MVRTIGFTRPLPQGKAAATARIKPMIEILFVCIETENGNNCSCWWQLEKHHTDHLFSRLLDNTSVSLLFSLGISATPLNNEMSEADKSKVESGQYSIVYGHRSRGWRHTVARGNAHKLSETYKNSVRRC